MIEIEGELVELRWQNPHVLFTIRTTDDVGAETLWNVETFTVSGVRRWGITPEILGVGEHFRVAGNPAWRDDHGIFVRHILLSSGEELIFGGNATPSTYMIDGRQFLVIAAGGGGKLRTRYGDSIVAFALPEE